MIDPVGENQCEVHGKLYELTDNFCNLHLSDPFVQKWIIFSHIN